MRLRSKRLEELDDDMKQLRDDMNQVRGDLSQIREDILNLTERISNLQGEKNLSGVYTVCDSRNQNFQITLQSFDGIRYVVFCDKHVLWFHEKDNKFYWSPDVKECGTFKVKIENGKIFFIQDEGVTKYLELKQ